MHPTPEQWLVIVMCTFTLVIVSVDVLLSRAILAQLRRRGPQADPAPRQPDMYAERMRRLGARLDDAVGRPWSMSVQPRQRQQQQVEGEDGG